jgi:ribosomal protein S18 acetylase RimI-like enzyme
LVALQRYFPIGDFGMMKLREAAAADVDFLADVFLRAMCPYIIAARGSWDQVREDRQFREQFRLGSTRILMDEEADVGFYMTYDQGPDLVLHTLCISPEHQRRGFGTAAIRQILSEARERHKGVVLFVLKANAGARSLYQRCGFVVIEETARHYRMRLDF